MALVSRVLDMEITRYPAKTKVNVTWKFLLAEECLNAQSKFPIASQ